MKNDIVFDSFKTVDLKSLSKCPLIVAYNKPIDYDDKVILRLWDNINATKYICFVENEEKICNYVPEGMIFFKKDEHDDNCIIGTFI